MENSSARRCRSGSWASAHPRVDPARLALFGGSKGGELALLVASRRDDLRAVVAGVPSSVVWQSIALGWPRTSSWSDAGEALPFVRYVRSKKFAASGALVDLDAESLRAADDGGAARIPVERIAAQVLIVSGEEDRTWPSTTMGDAVVRGINADGRERATHARYTGVGHEVLAPGYRMTSWSPRVGGTRAGQARAQSSAWITATEFLVERLSAP